MNCVVLHYPGGEVLLEAEDAVRLAELLLAVSLGTETWDIIPGKEIAVSRNSSDYCNKAREAVSL